MKVLNYLIRTLYYFRNGYGIYLNLPIGVLSFSTTTYYLMIQNIPALKSIFPGFIEFMVVLVVVLYPLGSVIGWGHFKALPFFRVEQEINVESNPYSQTRITPIMVPMWRTIMEIGRKEGVDVRDMEKMLAENY